MMKFYVTFGQKYRYETHPKFPNANPDGWLEVEAVGYDHARNIIVENLGMNWTFMYDEDQMKKHLYPMGCLGVLK